MNAFIVLFLAALVVLAVFAYAVRRHRQQLRSLEDFRTRWRRVDVEAFANLVDPAEERFLRASLPAGEFRRLRRERLFVAWEYLRRVGQNAQLMVQAGQIIQRHNTGEDAARARQHVATAIRLRTLVLMAQCGLVAEMILPWRAAPLENVVSLYSDAAHSFDNVLDPVAARVTM